MFDVAPSEFMIVAVVALLVIGPKDLPRLMRTVGQWVGRARGVARHFRSGIDTMMREAELQEMEKRWADENARIMAEHPQPADPSLSVHQTPTVVPHDDQPPVAEDPTGGGAAPTPSADEPMLPLAEPAPTVDPTAGSTRPLP